MTQDNMTATNRPRARLRPLLLIVFSACMPLSVALQQTALGLLIGLLAWSVWRGEKLRRSSLDWPLAIFFGALLLSSVLSPEVLGSLKSFRRLWLVAAFFAGYQLIREPKEIEGMVSAMVISATLVAAYGILQHFTGLDLARQLVGKESNLDRVWFAGQTAYRTKGLHPSGITYAHNLLFPLAFAVALLSRPATRSRARAGLLIAVALMVVSLFFSLTRGAWITAALLVPMTAALRRGRQLPWLLAAVVVPAVILIASSGALRQRAASSFDLEANLGRQEIWQANLDMLAARPLLGWGYGNYKRFRASYYAPYEQANTTAHAHNNLLQIAVEGGLFGLAGFLYLVWAILRSTWLAYRTLDAREQHPASAAAGAFLAVAGFMLAGLTQYNFGDAEVVIVFWWTAALGTWTRDFACRPTGATPGDR